ncbi:uncharacterized protein LOC133298634, partial [Gastrolobium bilobum]|uniref:uncharacterized protein LOC133298634 n=1 Tax=Gastrolobium bilobum TaxID=150636 RepID=UPI002AAF74DF
MVNPKEHCKAIMTRSGLVLQQVKKNVGNKKNEEEVVVEDVVSDDGVENVKGNEEKETVTEDKEEKKVVVENDVMPKKIMKWEKKKMADKQDQPVTLSPCAKALENMPHYAKFMKDLLTKKRKLNVGETMALTAECSALIQKKLPPKLQDPGSFSISIAIGDVEVEKALCDLGASINLMPLTVCRALGINTLKETNLILHLADKSIKKPEGVVEDVLVKVDKFIFPVDFVILDMEEEDTEMNKEEDFSLEEDRFIEEKCTENCQEEPVVEELETKIDDIPVGAPKVELKELPSNLKYVFLGNDQTYPVIINAMLSESEEVKLIKIAVAPDDHEKTAFTCPYGIFAYRRMPFDFCNALATFQRCQDCNLVLNWEKCHFMVTEGIVLGHKVSRAGIEVDRAKISVIEKLPPPVNVK